MRTTKPNMDERWFLTGSVALGEKVLRAYETGKTLRPLHGLIFAFFARLVGSAKSINVLVDGRQWPDIPVVLRSLYDSAVSIEYLLARPGDAKLFLELLRIESVMDQFDEMELCRQFFEKTKAQFFRDNPDALRVQRERDDAIRKISAMSRRTVCTECRQPDFESTEKCELCGQPILREPQQWPRRWMDISIDDKRSYLGPNTLMTRFFMSHIGNSFAHGRPFALSHFIRGNFRKGEIKFNVNPVPKFFDGKSARLFAAFGLLAPASQLAQHFDLGLNLERQIAALGFDHLPKAFKEDFDRLFAGVKRRVRKMDAKKRAATKTAAPGRNSQQA